MQNEIKPCFANGSQRKLGVHRPVNSVTTQHLANIFSIKFLQDEHLIASGAADGKVFLTDLESLETVISYDMEKRVKRLATSSEFTFYAASENGKVTCITCRN